MAASSTCMRCFAGTYIGGVCSHCGKPMAGPGDIVPTALQPGYILHGRYMLGYPLGHGGFGITYPAYDLKHQRRVAIKEFFPTGFASRDTGRATVVPHVGKETTYSEIMNGFRREANSLMKLQGNSGIIALYHAFEENGTAYYAMELLEGEDFRTMLGRNGRMTWQTLAPILRPVMQGISKVHAAGLIHRDLSPDNIFLTKNGTARLIDFGSARSYVGADHFTVILKHGFAPWEQYLSQGNQGPWTDVYSLCATAYYALTGIVPEAATERRVDDQLVPLEKMCPDVPPYVARAIAKGMAILSKDRYQTVRELYDALYLQTVKLPSGPSKTIVCKAGALLGRTWMLQPGSFLHIGRDSTCEIRFPEGTPGISRRHCTIALDPSGHIRIRDEGAKYGTVLVYNGYQVRLTQGQWYTAEGCILYLGGEQFLLP